jgi:hypothetical protein
MWAYTLHHTRRLTTASGSVEGRTGCGAGGGFSPVGFMFAPTNDHSTIVPYWPVTLSPPPWAVQYPWLSHRSLTSELQLWPCTAEVNYCPVLKRMQLTFTEWVESLNTGKDGRGKTYRSCQKHGSLSMHDLLSTGRHLLGVSLITTLKSHFCTAVPTQNATENSCNISYAQNTTAPQPYVFLTGIRRLLLTNKGRSAVPSVKNFQGQLRSLQSVSVLTPFRTLLLRVHWKGMQLNLALISASRSRDATNPNVG